MTKRRDEIIDIIMTESTLILSDRLISLLKASPGDKITIGYIDKEGTLTPTIQIGEEGNKLTQSNTVSFRGKKHNTLTEFGSNFWASQEGEVIVLSGDGLPIYTDVKKASETYITKEIIQDTTFNITKLENYEF